MNVLVDGGIIGRPGAVYGPATVRVVVVAFAEVPGVVSPCLAFVYFLPGVLANVANEEARTSGIRIEG